MYAFNQTNSLYFHPHKLHFLPVSDAADSEKRNRWFPGHGASVTSQRANAPVRQGVTIPGIDPPASDKYRQGMDADRMDDDGVPNSNTDSRKR